MIKTQPLSQTSRAVRQRAKYRAIAEHHRAYVADYKRRNPQRVAAQQAVRRAVRNGSLVIQLCADCGTCSEKRQAHHSDYSKPLEVEWLCVSCHRLRHSGGTKKPPREPRPPHPSRNHLTRTPRGWIKKINGLTRWICSSKIASTVEAADAYFDKHFGKLSGK